MSLASWMFTLSAVVPSQNAIAVDADGDRVALRSGPMSVAVYERRKRDWVPLAAGPLDSDFDFVGEHFVQGGTVRAFEGRRIAADGTPIDGVESGALSAPALVSDDLAFFWTETFSLGGTIVSHTGDALGRVATIAPTKDIGDVTTRQSGLVAFSDTRLAVVNQPPTG